MKSQWAPLIYITGYTIAGFLLIRYAVPFFLPFLVAIGLALAIETPVQWIGKHTGVSRGVAVAAILTVVCGTTGTLLGLGVARLVGELVRLSVSLPAYYYRASVLMEDLMELMSELTASLPAPFQNMVEQQVGKIYLAVEAIVSAVLDALKSLPSLIGVLIISLIATFFISRDRKMLSEVVSRLVPGVGNGKLARAQQEVINSTIGLLKAQLILVFSTAAVVIIALWLMGNDYALVLGLVIGMLDILPVLGPGLVFIPWAIYSLVFGSVAYGVMLLVLYGGISASRQVIQAKVIGDKTGLHPLATLFAMYLGARMLGAPGIFLGPLLAIVLKAFITAGIMPSWPGGGGAS